MDTTPSTGELALRDVTACENLLRHDLISDNLRIALRREIALLRCVIDYDNNPHDPGPTLTDEYLRLDRMF